jgi:hypothetical protein
LLFNGFYFNLSSRRVSGPGSELGSCVANSKQKPEIGLQINVHFMNTMNAFLAHFATKTAILAEKKCNLPAF